MPRMNSLWRKIFQYTSHTSALAYMVDVVQKIVAEREKNKSASTVCSDQSMHVVMIYGAPMQP